jgi:hypothetical protein
MRTNPAAAPAPNTSRQVRPDDAILESYAGRNVGRGTFWLSECAVSRTEQLVKAGG